MRLSALIVTLLFFLSAVNFSNAAEVSFSNNPSIIQKDQEIIFDVTVTGAASNTTNYIRPAFFNESSPTSYFGYVYNHLSNWYNGTPSPIDPKQFLEIQINAEGSWSGQLKVKADTNSPYFKGNGIYFLKVGRYTASATSVSNWSDAKTVEIQGAAPTSMPTAKQTPTDKPTNTPKAVNNSSVQKTSTNLVPSTLQESSIPTGDEELSKETIETDNKKYAVLGEVFENVNSPTSSETPDIKESKRNSFPLLIIIGAMILIIGCVILLASAYREQKKEEI